MVQEQSQNHQELIDLKILMQKCYIAEAKLASFLLEMTRTKAIGLSIDDVFKMKGLTDKVENLVREIQASDENSQDNDPTTTTQNLRKCHKSVQAIRIGASKTLLRNLT
jgi:hypothetical protein